MNSNKCVAFSCSSNDKNMFYLLLFLFDAKFLWVIGKENEMDVAKTFYTPTWRMWFLWLLNQVDE